MVSTGGSVGGGTTVVVSVDPLSEVVEFAALVVPGSAELHAANVSDAAINAAVSVVRFFMNLP